MRILIVAHGHPERSAGGGEFAAYRLFRGLRQLAGIEAHFLAWTDTPGPAGRDAHLNGVAGRPDETLIHTEHFDSFLLSQPSRRIIEEFMTLVRSLDPDIVHFHHYTNLGLEFIAAARSAKPSIGIVLTLHDYLAICHHYGTMVKTGSFELCEAAGPEACAGCFADIGAAAFARRQAHVRSLLAEADLFISPSAFLRRRYVEWGLPAAKFAVIENGIDPVQPPRPRPVRAGERRAVFGYFGQIHPFKGVLELLAALEHVAELSSPAARDIRLVIHGAHLELNGPAYVARFNRLLARHGKRVRFAGAYAQQDQARLMAAVDWVVVPSLWWENSPLVIQEALAHRRPVLCSGIGGMAEKVQPGRDGFHFPAGDARALSQLLLRLAEDGAIWSRLRESMRSPTTTAESVARHLQAYRH